MTMVVMRYPTEAEAAKGLLDRLEARRNKVGRCRYDKPTNQIMIQVHEGYEYEVDLDRCETAGACLDWIHQVSSKTWGREVMADFVEILFNYIDTELLA